MEARGYHRGFAHHEEWSWEVDFKDDDFEGMDYLMADDVDIVYYEGHGSPRRVFFCGPYNKLIKGGEKVDWWSPSDDHYLSYSDAVWGDDDLEWIVLYSCGVLHDGTWPVWESAFDGLHLILGFATTAYDTGLGGEDFVRWAHPHKYGGLIDVPAYPLRVAWALSAIHGQPSLEHVWYAIMGVFGISNESTHNDYLWGQGPVSPDLRGSTGPFAIGGFWRLSGPAY